MATNCWEVMHCGREPGGVNEKELEGCPVPVFTNADGLNNGTNGGRACWAIAGTLCGKDIEGTFAKNQTSCLCCEFYNLVTTEEGFDFIPTKELLNILKDQ